MCLSFLNYYPRMGMTDCYSSSYPQSFVQFLSRHYRYENTLDISCSSYLSIYSQSQISSFASNLTRSRINEIFNNITWTHNETEVLEDSVSTGSQYSFCYGPVSCRLVVNDNNYVTIVPSLVTVCTECTRCTIYWLSL